MHLMSDSSQVSANFIYQCQSYKRISVLSNYWSAFTQYFRKVKKSTFRKFQKIVLMHRPVAKDRPWASIPKY